MSTENIEQGEIEEQVPLDTPPEVDNEPDAAQQELEARARRQGWRPKDEYRGPPGRWRSAEEFLAHGENEWPVLRERLKKADEREAKLMAELEEQRKKVTEVSEVLVEMRDIQTRQIEAEIARRKREAEVQMQRAVETSDLPSYHQAKTELDQVEASRPQPRQRTEAPPPSPPPPQPQDTIDPAIKVWTAENAWFERDPVLKAYAIDVDSDLMRRFPGMATSDRLDEVRRQTVGKFPEKFASPRRAQAAPVTGSSPPAPRPKGKTYEDLPADAKASCDRFVATIPGYKREDYVKMYFQGEQ